MRRSIALLLLAASAAAEDWDRETRARLATPVTLQAESSGQVLDAIATAAGVRMAIDPTSGAGGWDGRVEWAAVPAHECLDHLAVRAGLAWTVAGGVVVVSTPDRIGRYSRSLFPIPPDASPEDAEVYRRMNAVHLGGTDFRIEGWGATEVLQFFEDVGGVDFLLRSLEPGSCPNQWSFLFRDISYPAALSAFLDALGARLRVAWGMVLIERSRELPSGEYLAARAGERPPDERIPELVAKLSDPGFEVRAAARRALLAAGPAALLALWPAEPDLETGERCRWIRSTIEEGEARLATWDPPSDFPGIVRQAGADAPAIVRALVPPDLAERPIDDSLAWWIRHGLDLRWDPGAGVYRHRAPARLAALDRETAFEGECVPLEDVAIVFEEKTMIPVVVDARAFEGGPPRVDVHEVDLRRALFALGFERGVEWAWSCGAIVLSTPEGIGRFEFEPPADLVAALPLEPLSIDVHDSVIGSLRWLGEEIDVEIDVDPALADRAVRLKAGGVDAPRLVYLLARLAGGRALVRGGRLVVDLDRGR